MTGWINYAAAFAAFFAAHAIPSLRGVKSGLKAVLGRRGYAALFSLLSVGLLVWLVVAAGRAPFVPLWDQREWMRVVANLAMPCAVALAAFGVAAPNPLSFDGRRGGFDPAHPGVAGVVRHPLLWAFLIWSLAHLLVNGDLAHVILFGAFALFSLAGMAMIDARKRRLLGAEWHRLAAHSSSWPLAAWFGGRWRPAGRPSSQRLAIAVVVWLGLLGLHPIVIGVSPLP